MKRSNRVNEQEKQYYKSIEIDKARIHNIEEQVKKRPTEKDLKESVKILKDFGIVIFISDIPKVNSVCELERWRAKRIYQYLNKK